MARKKQLRKPKINTEKCIACGLCHTYCPMEAIEAVGLYEYQVNQEKCIACLICYKNCDSKAIELVKISNA